MCGISGYLSSKELINESAIPNTLKLMERRGPDSQNYFTEQINKKEIALLHSRLNIIDLNERSNQPFFDQNLVLIFNGEIYNYIELRNNLISKGYHFKTNSDTEVLIKSYMEYGEKCVDYFVGMWAFAIWDKIEKKLFLSRDIFGEKPLYYLIDGECFIFGSEIKFIKSLYKKKLRINKKQINKNLFCGYKSLTKDSSTFFDKVYSLKNSSNLTIDLNLKKKNQIFWKPNLKINKKITKKEAAEGAIYYLKKSIDLRLRSDVPIAFCLSGGIDSSLLTSIASKKFKKKISTFSIIDEDERYNEKINIDKIVNNLGCENYSINLKDKKNFFFDRLNDLTKYHDCPISTNSYYIHSFLSEEISNKGYKVSISGTGADEIFTGYYDHFLLHLETQKKSKNFNKYLDDWKKYVLPNLRNSGLKDPFLYINDNNNRKIVYEDQFNLKKYSIDSFNIDFDEIDYCDELLRKRMLNELFHEVVPIILKHDDLNSMYFSVENRSPYLDRDLLSFALTLPPGILIEGGFQKKVLRDSAKGFLNEDVRLDRKKKGFNSSISSLISLKNTDDLESLINNEDPINEFINFDSLKKDINFNSIPNHFSKLIFSIITTNMFLKDNENS